MAVVKVTAKVTDLGKNQAKDIRDFVRKHIGNAELTVGVYANAIPYPSGVTVAEVALWNEFGTTKIPERSFIRSAVDQNQGKIEKVINDMWTELLDPSRADKKGIARKHLQRLGFMVKTFIESKILSNVPPPYGTGKSGATAEVISARQEQKRRRGAVMGSNTLIETGHLLKSIAWQVKVGGQKSKSDS